MKLERKLSVAIESKNTNLIEEVFENIYYEYGKLVGFIISKYVIRKEDIEEIVDDVFVSFFKAIFKTKINNIKYYLVVQAKNAAINFIKSKNNTVYDEQYVNSLYDENYHYYIIINEMEKVLTNEEINIILLHDIYNYSFNEISNKYQKPIFTISSIYRRAVKKIKKEK